MIRNSLILAGAASILVVNAHCQVVLSPKATFSPNGDGHFSNLEGGYTHLNTGDLQRGLGFGNDHIYLPSRFGGNNIRILDKLTGADLGSLPLGSGIISGGTFQINTVRVGSDGAIYVANLASPVGATTPFKVYRWANESSTPTLAFSSTTITGGRMGDDFDVIGGGTSTLLVAGESSSAGAGARNGYAVMSTVDGANFIGSLVTFGSPPIAGDFRLGITFTDSSHVIGTASGPLRYTSFSGAAGTLIGSSATISTLERGMDYSVINGMPILATISSGDSRVRLYDASNPSSLSLLTTSIFATSATNSNANGTSAVAWGDVESYNGDGTTTVRLYALNSNNGIQAFTVTVPEPASVALIGIGICGLIGMRRFRK